MAIMLTIPTLALAEVTLDNKALVKKFGRKSWNDKKRTAVKYKDADSNYRTYKPTATPTPTGGLLVSTKINHIRGGVGPIGAADDYCNLELTFDSQGKLVSTKADTTIGDKKFDTGIITSVTEDPLTEGATKAFDKLADWVGKLGEGGGRKNFPSVIKHNINRIAGSVQVK